MERIIGFDDHQKGEYPKLESVVTSLILSLADQCPTEYTRLGYTILRRFEITGQTNCTTSTALLEVMGLPTELTIRLKPCLLELGFTNPNQQITDKVYFDGFSLDDAEYLIDKE